MIRVSKDDQIETLRAALREKEARLAEAEALLQKTLDADETNSVWPEIAAFLRKAGSAPAVQKYESACPLCGGALSTHQHMMDCKADHLSRRLDALKELTAESEALGLYDVTEDKPFDKPISK